MKIILLLFSFHGCPKCIPDRDKELPLTSKTAGEAYIQTMDRRHFLEQRGYSLTEKWECELNAELEQDRAMRVFFKSQQLVTPLDPREALMGGRTNATVLTYTIKDGEKINYADVCSLYVFPFRFFTCDTTDVGGIVSAIPGSARTESSRPAIPPSSPKASKISPPSLTRDSSSAGSDRLADSSTPSSATSAAGS